MDANVRYMEAELEAQHIEAKQDLPDRVEEEIEIRKSPRMLVEM